MQLQVPPDVETPINKRLSSGAYNSPEEVLRRALELQDAEESLTDDERLTLSAHVEEGYLQAERGELIEGEEARAQIEAMKENSATSAYPGATSSPGSRRPPADASSLRR